MCATTVPTTKADVRKVLVVDDQEDVREALRLLLKGAGYAAEMAESPKDALAAAAYCDHDAVVMDMNYTWDTTSGREGLDLIDNLHRQCPSVPIIAMTGWSTIELAVEAMHRGACDFITKPWDRKHLLEILNKYVGSESASNGRASGLETELAIARKIQRTLLPQPHLSACGIECDCASLPAGEISGDLYDFFPVDSERVAFMLGDVSGKGIGAALLMANLQATIRSRQDLAVYPSKLMDEVNRAFFLSTRPEHYATLFFGLYDSSRRSIHYVNCGHPSGVVLRRDGEPELLESTASVLGLFKACPFKERTVPVNVGDRLILFSDGLSEARLDDGDDDWVIRAVRALARTHARGLAGSLATAAITTGKHNDDVTVMDIRIGA